MKAQTTGTLLDGIVRLDQHVDVPNNSRVNVSIETMGVFTPNPIDPRAAFDSFKELIQQHPIRSGGHHYTRDELHERR